MQIHYFNPGHETEVWLDKDNYTPPANVARMRNELAALPIWYAEAGSAVYLDNRQGALTRAFLKQLPQEIVPDVQLFNRSEIQCITLSSTEIQPWGLSRPALHLFQKLQAESRQPFSVPAWKTEYRSLGSRRTAATCLDRIRQLLPDYALPDTPVFLDSEKNIPIILRKYQDISGKISRHLSSIIKTPYSSSGRGILWIQGETPTENERKWIEGALAKQGEVSIEPALDKVEDFAIEYYSDGKGTLDEVGLSLFETGNGGAYGGNLLMSQTELANRITLYIGPKLFDQAKEAVRQALREIFSTTYRGYLGVDMLIYRTDSGGYAIHPCVEINMRYTMGLVALQLYQQRIQPESEGYFRIEYTQEKGGAYASHLAMQQTHPLVIREGKILSGYLPLCPVSSETHYRAYSIIFAMPISKPRSSANPRKRPIQE